MCIYQQEFSNMITFDRFMIKNYMLTELLYKKRICKSNLPYNWSDDMKIKSYTFRIRIQ